MKKKKLKKEIKKLRKEVVRLCGLEKICFHFTKRWDRSPVPFSNISDAEKWIIITKALYEEQKRLMEEF